MNSRTLVILGLVIAGLCLVRVLSVAAANRDDDVEVYSSTEKAGSGDSDSRSSSGDGEDRPEIKLSRPDEAEGRIADDRGYNMVPGVERLQGREMAENTLIVPTKVGRKISSEVALPPVDTSPSSPIEVRAEAVSPPASQGKLSAAPLSAEVMEPKPFSNADARERAAEVRKENIVASNKPLGRTTLGIHSEPEPETKIDPPVPASAMSARAGVQEISLIVSDYGFFPSRLFVTQNVPVKIYLTTPSKVTMCFMLDMWGLKKGVLPGRVEEISFVPAASGNYRFYCPVKSIEGTLTVREAQVSEQSARGLASKPEPAAGRGNEPKRAAELRALIDD